MNIFTIGSSEGLSAVNVLAHSFKALKGLRWATHVQGTGVPSFVTDVFLALKDLNHQRKEHWDILPPLVIYAKVKGGPSTGFACPSALLTFLLTERELGYPCIIDAGVRRTVCTARLSRVSPLTAVADTIRIASGDYSPSGQGPRITPPTLDRENVDSLRSLVHHWVRPLDGLNLAGLLDQGFDSLKAAFQHWDSESWYDRHHWRSFYALCLWFSHLPDPVPPRNDVQPGNVCWKQWGRLLVLLYDDHASRAADLFNDNQQALKRCLRWI